MGSLAGCVVQGAACTEKHSARGRPGEPRPSQPRVSSIWLKRAYLLQDVPFLEIRYNETNLWAAEEHWDSQCPVPRVIRNPQDCWPAQQVPQPPHSILSAAGKHVTFPRCGKLSSFLGALEGIWSIMPHLKKKIIIPPNFGYLKLFLSYPKLY